MNNIIMYPMSNETYASLRARLGEILRNPNVDHQNEVMDVIQDAYRVGCKTGHRIGLAQYRDEIEKLFSTTMSMWEKGLETIFGETSRRPKTTR